MFYGNTLDVVGLSSLYNMERPPAATTRRRQYYSCRYMKSQGTVIVVTDHTDFLQYFIVRPQEFSTNRTSYILKKTLLVKGKPHRFILCLFCFEELYTLEKYCNYTNFWTFGFQRICQFTGQTFKIY